MKREDMTREQELEHVNTCFDNYEKEGFAETFQSPYEEVQKHNGKKFKVNKRLKPSEGYTVEDETHIPDLPVWEVSTQEGMSDLETLPAWEIELEDGEIIGAYPEEIIPSEIIKHKKMKLTIIDPRI